MTITLGNGSTVELCDWVDDKVYQTIELGAASGRRRSLPDLGHLPGEHRMGRYRWPDVIRIAYVHMDFDGVLRGLRAGSVPMSYNRAWLLVGQLDVRDSDRHALIDIFMATHFGDADSEWALVHLIDAAVEIAADQSRRLMAA